MDIRTLGIVTCVCAATMATTFGAMSRLSPADRCLKDWTWAALLLLVNNVFGVVVLSYELHPHPVAVAIANACTIAGYVLMLSGVRFYLRRALFQAKRGGRNRVEGAGAVGSDLAWA